MPEQLLKRANLKSRIEQGEQWLINNPAANTEERINKRMQVIQLRIELGLLITSKYSTKNDRRKN
jgi:hypothetical protein